MKFEYNQYFKMICIGCLIMFSFFFFLTIFEAISYFKKQFHKEDNKFSQYLLSVFIDIVFLYVSFCPLINGIHLISEKENDKVEAIGTINKITEAQGIDKYAYEGKTVFASYVYIDDEKYYIMYIGDFEEGDTVRFEYLPKSKVILSIDDA